MRTPPRFRLGNHLRVIWIVPFLLIAGLAHTESDPGFTLKRKVAISRFSNETKSQLAFLVDEAGDRIGKQAADILSARLAQTGKFLLFERQDRDDVSSEKVLQGLKEQGVGVDYLILGSVSEFGRSTESQSGVFQRAKTQKAYSKVNVRLVEVSTGRIIFAAEGAGEATSETKKTLGVGSSAGFDQTLTDKSLSAAISQLVSKLIEKLTDKPWRSYLLEKEGDLYLMSGGARQGLLVGMSLNLYLVGKTIKNPQTGLNIELPGKKVGSLTVSQTLGDDEFNEVSLVKVISGVIDEPLEKYYVLAD